MTYNSFMNLISTDLLQKHLRFISQFRDAFENPENLESVETYIRQAFQEYGYEVRDHRFVAKGKDFSNLIAAKPHHSEIPNLIIGAHFDAMPGTPGADDNASGVAAMLEAARLFALAKSRVNVHFIAFNLEEYGMLGSQAYLEKFKTPLIEAHRKGDFLGMLSLEMVGYTNAAKGSQKMPAPLKLFYPDTGTFLALVGDNGSQKLLKEAKAAFKSNELKVESLRVPLQGHLFSAVRLSDHSPFWDAGLPALLVTDTSFFRNPHYHLASDTVETLDLAFLAQITQGVINLITSYK